MNVSTLCNDVLLQVFQYVNQQPYTNIMDWSRPLPLLGVCSNWRRALAPLIYSLVYVETSQTQWDGEYINPQVETEDEFAEQIPDPEPDGRLSWNTNLDLLESSLTKYPVETVYLDMIDSKTEFTSILNIAALLKSKAMSWQHAKTLWIKTTSMMGFYNQPYNSKMCRAKGQYLAEALANVLPNVTQMEYTGYGISQSTSTLLQGLTDIYSHQLLHLNTGFKNIYFSPQAYLGAITFLRINITKLNEYQLCKVFAGSLEYLQVDYIEPTFPWYQLCDLADHPTAVYFARLLAFKVSYCPLSTSESQKAEYMSFNYQFYFPKLQHLHIEGCINDYSLLANSRFPAYLSSVVLNGSIDAAAWLARTRVQMANLSLTLDCSQNVNSAAFIPLMNVFYGPHSMANCASFHTQSNYITSANLEAINWQNITELSICMLPNMRELVKIMHSMPLLHRLQILYHNNYDICSDLLDCPSVGISKLTFVVTKHCTFDEEAITVMVALLKISTMLDRLTVPALPLELLEELVDENKSQYPHMSKIWIG